MMLEAAELSMSPRLFDDAWCPPFCDAAGIWRSNPPGYRVGFIVSPERVGAERGRVSVYRSLAGYPHPIWC